MTEPVVTYTCPLAGTEHSIPGPDTRLIRTGDGGFIVACDCAPEPLDETDSKPHPTTDHLVNIYADDPSPDEWLQLEAAADGWYATSAWASPDGYDGTNGQRRAQFRQQVEDLADNSSPTPAEPTDRQKATRGVPCPSCDAGENQKCRRPSGHEVRIPHSDRITAAVEAGIISPADDTDQSEPSQADLGTWAD